MKEIDDILKSGILSGFRANEEYHLGGKYVQAFEKAFREYFDIKYAIAFNSATAALHSALIACGIGSGDEVIVSPYSFSSSASCVLMAGAKPVFADIDDRTFNVDAVEVAQAIELETAAIIPVHLMGHPADMNGIMEVAKRYNLKVIEDVAQSIGATYEGKYVGTIGDCGIFSFNQSKHVNTGEGGMMITNDDEIAEIARAVRNHGEVSVPYLKVLGYNYRMTEIEAVIGLEQFGRLDKIIDIRVQNALRLTEELSKIDGLTPPVIHSDCTHSFYTYALKIEPNIINLNKETLCGKLAERNIYFGTYVKPLYLLPIYEGFGYREGLCPIAEDMWRNKLIVSDIIKNPNLDIEYISEAFRGIVVYHFE